MNNVLEIDIESLNQDIKEFPQVHPVTNDMYLAFSGVSRLVMIDRYSFKDLTKKTLKPGDIVVLTVKEDPKFPARGIGKLLSTDGVNAEVLIDPDYRSALTPEEFETGVVVRKLSVIEKPLELFYEQIALRNATGLASVEKTPELQEEWTEKFYQQLAALNFVPAGRVLYGAGSGNQTTFFNCYVMPYPKDSREGISDHRAKVMEIMSRGGGVGTNGSTLRPRNALARGVNGKSSGSVSWLNDIANLTNLVEQGGSRRGAQMIMMADSHPDIYEFIISKMQNTRILRYLIEYSKDDVIVQLAKDKLKFTPLTDTEKEQLNLLKLVEAEYSYLGRTITDSMQKAINEAKQKLEDGGTWSVHNPDFLTGANISVAFTKDFMKALENGETYSLRFPDVENYTPEQMKAYNEKWHEVGDPREWEAMGYPVKTYRTIKATDLWELVNICATYSAEPGIFFIDSANDMTNAKSYGQKVVCTNPCGEQPLAPYSVCNLAAVNLAEMVNKETKQVDYDKLIETVKIGIRMQDNVISATPYFLEENQIQALGERRIGLGVMGLADMLIYAEKVYGTDEGNDLVDKVFEAIATAAYEESVELSKERGSFPFLDDNGVPSFEKRTAFVNSGFMKTMPEHIRQGVLEHGIRNSHLLTVAPTGSTGTMIGTSTGLEPYFSFSYFRSGRLGKFIEVNASIVDEYYERYYAENPEADKDIKPPLPPWFISAMELAPEAHADTQCVIQRWVDSSISKTVNAPRGYSVEQVQKVYERLFAGGAKGGTVYVDGSRDSQVLTLKAEENTEEAALPDEDNRTVVFIDDTIPELTSTSVLGTDIGDTCPVCQIGTVEDLGGCHTCTNCSAQLVCGL